MLLTVLIFLVAITYAAVGLGGGSGYLAAMGLVGLEPALMRPTALALNILVAGLSTWKFARAGHFSARIFWPLALASVPLAFLGGRLSLPGAVYRPVVGLLLLYAAYVIMRRRRAVTAPPARGVPAWLPWLVGAGLGFVAGLIGTGGGIFLGPVLLLTGWLETRAVLGVTAAFVLVNSVAGLLGQLTVMAALPAELPFWLLAAGAGGWLGAELGSRRLAPARLRLLLAGVLVVAGVRLMF